MTTHFKLKLTGGPTRRLSFTDEPTWSLLAERIAGLFDIPADSVAVAYIDSEDDEVTLSTQEELQDFYQTSYKPGDVVKFAVEDLRIPRRRARLSPTTPPGPNLRNTFGGSMSEGLPFNIDEDWQHLPPEHGGFFLGGNAGREDSSLHAFVEELESGASTISGAQHDETTSISDSDSHVSTVIPPRVDKGKGKARDLDASSTASLLEEKTFEKPDIHVYDVKNVKTNEPTQTQSRLSRRSSRRSSVAPITTPKAHSIPPTSIPVLPSETESAEAADPPLPLLDSASLEHANTSLSIDVANLLSNLATIVSTHPELSEGFRNILRNAAAGTYWTAQRDAMSQAANIARSVTEELSRADQEAGRRVSDALGLLFRTISQTVGTIPTAATGGPSSPPQSPPPPSPPADNMRWGSGLWERGWGGRHWHGHGFGHVPSRESFFGRPSFGPPPSLQRDQTVMDDRSALQPPDNIPASPANPAPAAGLPTPLGRGGPGRTSHIISNARGSFPQFEMVSVPSPLGPSTGPRRSHTLPGHALGRGPHGHPHGRRHTSEPEDPVSRAVNRINRKLADMGFSETAHPDLAAKVRAAVPQDGALSRDFEDEIVTNLLEELVIRTKTPAGPGASSSRR
ncbi:hypothetical protein DFH05DRAFT_1387853 [Lentinula detonsa]|uniref:PB1 domain-containing protein n=1 Tax=Lentinula detonsa TaxID=2804962 RepID=A0A9W8PBD0_9AGAR|nr:hypothetical protein DFH05DRAFT_1387853 [Lentinula detonsa]